MVDSEKIPGLQCPRVSEFQGFPISHFPLTCSGFYSAIKDRKYEIGNRKFSEISDFALVKFQSYKKKEKSTSSP